MNKVRKTKELDHYLKRIILKVPDEIQRFLDDEDGEITMIYYSGNWSNDIYDNFTELQAEKIFKRMAQFQNKLVFVQKRLEQPVGGYEYQVARF